MCRGAIPGDEIQTAKTCPGCGADLSHLIRQRLTSQGPAAPVSPPRSTSFITQAAWFSILAPCLGVAANLIGRLVLTESPTAIFVLDVICPLVIVGGFTSGAIAFFAPKIQKSTMGKAIAGICLNGVLIAFAILNLFTRQKPATSDNKSSTSPRKGWSYISGR